MNKHYKDMPKTLRIGCFEYAVVLMGGSDQDNDRIYGDMSSSRQRIRLAPGLTPQRLANTFLHEVIHAIHHYVGVGDDTCEEMTTTLGANGLCAFWQDNPEACRWWVKINAEKAQ